MIRVLFVCTGNICRSPTAEGIFHELLTREGLANEVEVASAGTGDYHIGEAPDRRAQAAAKARGYDLSGLVAKQVHPNDFKRYDYLIAMDRSHYDWLKRRSPEAYKDRIHLLLDFGDSNEREVPDPYYGGNEGFEKVLDLIERASHGLLEDIRQRNAAGGRA